MSSCIEFAMQLIGICNPFKPVGLCVFHGRLFQKYTKLFQTRKYKVTKDGIITMLILRLGVLALNSFLLHTFSDSKQQRLSFNEKQPL